MVEDNGGEVLEQTFSNFESNLEANIATPWRNDKFENGDTVSSNIENITESESEMFMFEPALEDLTSGNKVV